MRIRNSVCLLFVKYTVNVKHIVSEQWPQQRLGLEMCHFVSHSHIYVVSVDTGIRSSNKWSIKIFS